MNRFLSIFFILSIAFSFSIHAGDFIDFSLKNLISYDGPGAKSVTIHATDGLSDTFFIGIKINTNMTAGEFKKILLQGNKSLHIYMSIQKMYDNNQLLYDDNQLIKDILVNGYKIFLIVFDENDQYDIKFIYDGQEKNIKVTKQNRINNVIRGALYEFGLGDNTSNFEYYVNSVLLVPSSHRFPRENLGPRSVVEIRKKEKCTINVSFYYSNSEFIINNKPIKAESKPIVKAKTLEDFLWQIVRSRRAIGAPEYIDMKWFDEIYINDQKYIIERDQDGCIEQVDLDLKHGDTVKIFGSDKQHNGSCIISNNKRKNRDEDIDESPFKKKRKLNNEVHKNEEKK